MYPILLSIALLHWIVLLTPGANFVLVSQLAAGGYRTRACFAAFGVTTVTLTWASLAILGIGMVFSAHPVIRQLVQVAGGIYLCYLAVRMWRSSHTSDGASSLTLSNWAAFRLGFLTNILNPKTALFFGSVFATALPAHPDTGLVLAAVALVYANALVWHLLLAFSFSHPQVQQIYARQKTRLSQVSGALVGAFGLNLVASAAREIRARLV